jgi:hypothetical protein
MRFVMWAVLGGTMLAACQVRPIETESGTGALIYCDGVACPPGWSCINLECTPPNRPDLATRPPDLATFPPDLASPPPPDLASPPSPDLATPAPTCPTCTPVPHATPVLICSLMCHAGWADCNHVQADGCETPLGTNTNCGACGNACTGGSTCQNGTCLPQNCSPTTFDCCGDGSICVPQHICWKFPCP